MFKKNFQEKKIPKKIPKRIFKKNSKQYFLKKSFENKNIFQKKFNPFYQNKPTSTYFCPFQLTSPI